VGRHKRGVDLDGPTEAVSRGVQSAVILKGKAQMMVRQRIVRSDRQRVLKGTCCLSVPSGGMQSHTQIVVNLRHAWRTIDCPAEQFDAVVEPALGKRLQAEAGLLLDGLPGPVRC
jgi:hypothetical protein